MKSAAERAELWLETVIAQIPLKWESGPMLTT